MERELNYLVLRYLENYLSKEDYESMKEKIFPKLDLPKIYSWSGNQKSLGFEQLCAERFHFPSKYLGDIFKQMMSKSKIPLFSVDNIQEQFERDDSTSLVKNVPKLPFSLKKRNFKIFGRSQNFVPNPIKNSTSSQNFIKKFDRVKTVYGHAVLGEQGMSIS